MRKIKLEWMKRLSDWGVTRHVARSDLAHSLGVGVPGCGRHDDHDGAVAACPPPPRPPWRVAYDAAGAAAVTRWLDPLFRSWRRPPCHGAHAGEQAGLCARWKVQPLARAGKQKGGGREDDKESGRGGNEKSWRNEQAWSHAPSAAAPSRREEAPPPRCGGDVPARRARQTREPRVPWRTPTHTGHRKGRRGGGCLTRC